MPSDDLKRWEKWHIKFVASLKSEAENRGWSFELLKNTFKKELPRARMFYVAGMKRAGNHAITNWMRKNCFESQLFFNNFGPKVWSTGITSYDADSLHVNNVEFLSSRLVERVICSFEHTSLDFFEEKHY